MVKRNLYRRPSKDAFRQKTIRWVLVMAVYCFTAVEIFMSGKGPPDSLDANRHFRYLESVDMHGVTPSPGKWSLGHSDLPTNRGEGSRKKCVFLESNSSLTGALDEYLCPGYVHDVYRVKKNTKQDNLKLTHDNIDICDEPLGLGAEGHYGYWGLNKIRIASTNNTPRVLCIVYTHSGLRDNLQSVLDTWAPKCDGFLAASNETVLDLGAVHILHKGNETYRNMWQKVRSTWTYVHDHYLDEFDFFHIGGDDMFLIPENLKHAMKDYKHKENEIVYVGTAMHDAYGRPIYSWNGHVFCSGGGGYTFNRHGLRFLVGILPNCWPDLEIASEDQLVSFCMTKDTHINLCENQADEHDESRYHPEGVNFHAAWIDGPTPWLANVLVKPPHNMTAIGKRGITSISATTISFHKLVNGAWKGSMSYNNLKYRARSKDHSYAMKRYHAIVRGHCRHTLISKESMSVQPNIKF